MNQHITHIHPHHFIKPPRDHVFSAIRGLIYVDAIASCYSDNPLEEYPSFVGRGHCEHPLLTLQSRPIWQFVPLTSRQEFNPPRPSINCLVPLEHASGNPQDVANVTW
jgi:hypothetical protein